MNPRLRSLSAAVASLQRDITPDDAQKVRVWIRLFTQPAAGRPVPAGATGRGTLVLMDFIEDGGSPPAVQ